MDNDLNDQAKANIDDSSTNDNDPSSSVNQSPMNESPNQPVSQAEGNENEITPSMETPGSSDKDFSSNPSHTQKEPSQEFSTQPPVETPKTPVTDKPKSSLFSSIVLFVVLFFIGVFLSIVLRQYIPTLNNINEQATQTTTDDETYKDILDDDGAYDDNGDIVDTPFWEEYFVINGITKEPVDDILYQLPSNVLEPICDGSTCASQGTYLPGGTRFTVAARGKVSIDPNWRKMIDFKRNCVSYFNHIPFHYRK